MHVNSWGWIPKMKSCLMCSFSVVNIFDVCTLLLKQLLCICVCSILSFKNIAVMTLFAVSYLCESLLKNTWHLNHMNLSEILFFFGFITMLCIWVSRVSCIPVIRCDQRLRLICIRYSLFENDEVAHIWSLVVLNLTYSMDLYLLLQNYTDMRTKITIPSLINKNVNIDDLICMHIGTTVKSACMYRSTSLVVSPWCN